MYGYRTDPGYFRSFAPETPTWAMADMVWVVGVRLEGSTVASFSESVGVESQDSKILDGIFYVIDDNTADIAVSGGLFEDSSTVQSMQRIEQIEDMREVER